MTIIGTLLVGSSIGLLLYTLVLYPLLALLLARRTPNPTYEAPQTLPPITLVIAARDEAAHIADRLANACALDYPDLRIVVASDGSTDDTESIASAFDDPRVTVVALAQPGGKTAAVAHAIEQAGRPGVFAFTDATAVWPSSALKELVAPLLDPSIGAVSGLVLYDYHDDPISQGFAAYQSLVVPSRQSDSLIGWVSSVSGSICALKSELWERVPHDLSTDLVYPLLAAVHGQRAILQPTAISGEDSRRRPGRELRSRYRLALNAYTFMGYLARRWSELPGRYRWQVVSHKVLRWLSPYLVLQCVLGALMLWPTLPAIALPIVSGAGAGVLLGVLGLVPVVGRYFAAPLWALTVAVAYLWGLGAYLTGVRVAGWDPESQR
ncbi:MAG: cellulose synthase/poly-beta-1,6-N-acetylglucosamine synthase-like glycosyltransferase [Myxococcota bacterium]|jgi:cellulose synthase/poly-beta-1,6-N-acetylglucosamine synthase-like glycosyltransferase